MNRRDLLKALGLMGASLTVPQMVGRNALAGISQRDLRNARAVIDGEINYVPPATLPVVINIFMYGGPSELAGNLSNIGRINTDSQNKYRADILTPFDAAANNAQGGGQITTRGMWADAGGLIMEDLITAGQMTLYRTINRIVDDSKAHRESIFSAQTGGAATIGSPGMGTTLAAILRVKNPGMFNSPGNEPILPFVSFEGDSVLYNQGDINDLPLWLRSVSLDNGFANPYQRKKFSAIAAAGSTTTRNCVVDGVLRDCNEALETLSRGSSGAPKFERLTKAFTKRKDLDDYFSNPTTGLSNPAAKMPLADIDGVPFDTQPFPTVSGVGIPQGIRTFTNDSFGNTLRAAIVLALENPDKSTTAAGTHFITLSTGGLGGWDDHDNSIDKYEQRVTSMLSNLRTAVRLLRTGTAAAGVLKNNPRNDVIINVYGEFGRNVNLNGSMGWDHGNNMNLYTFGGSGVANRALGKVIGSTQVIGTPGQNRLFTSPADSSPQWEPYCIAATVYRYFGVQNPETLTKDSTIAGAQSGFGAIDGFPGAIPLTS
jgi:hypothetical protein